MEFKEADWVRAKEIEEEQIKQLCYKLVEFEPDLIMVFQVHSIFISFILPLNLSL